MVLDLIISIVIMVVVGGLAGWAAHHIVDGSLRTRFTSPWAFVVIGILGAILAGFFIPIPIGGILGSFLGALIGAILILLLIKLFDRMC